ncbi:MAG: pyridoxamine 5'-phosphate oxidase family protein [Chloroflexi bacterium]|nr:pyridoxamine 5'-phosphate oxidase family protein [Chloroflexota bacterium]MDA1241081.1 pyridoxamine 5'-phosphate oxidase family protein [Chloroflexota bacterium]
MPLTPRLGRPHFDPSYGITGDPEGASWPATEQKLAAARNYWVATTRAGGAPHAKPVWGLWQDGALWFGSAANSVTGRNLARDPRISVHLESGDDVVILEGRVELTIPPREVMTASNRKYAMPEEHEAEGAAWYRLTPTTALTWRETDFLRTVAHWTFD